MVVRVCAIALLFALVAAISPTAGLSADAHFAANGISFQYPHEWFVTTERLSNGIDPRYLFAVSSHSIRRTPQDTGPCLPGVARQIPNDGVLVYLREAVSGRDPSLRRMQPRPRRFRLPTRSDNALCGFPRGRWIPFRSGGRAFYLGVYVGEEATMAKINAVKRVIDGMRIASRKTP